MKPSANDKVSPSRKAKLLHLIEETVRTWWWKDTPQQMCSRLAEYIDSSELIEAACSQTGREIKRYMVHEARVRWEKDLAEWLEDQDAFNATREQRAVFWLLLELKDAERLLAAPPAVSTPRPTPEELSVSFDLLFGKYRVLLRGNADPLVLLDYEDEIRRRAGENK